MTILNLAIGLHTGPAKEDMRVLTAWLKENAPSVGVTLDVKSLHKQLASLTALPVVDVKVNGDLVKAEISRALKEAFATRHTVLINTDALTKSVHDAATEGLKGLKAHVAASTTGAAQPAAAASAVSSAIDTAVISTAIRDAVATTSDMMAKTFGDVIGQQAKKSKGAASASVSQSVTASDGTKGSIRVPISEEGDVKNLLSQIDDQTALKAAEKRNKEMQNLDAGEESRRSKYIKESEKALSAKKSIDAAWAQAEEEARRSAEAAKEKAWNAFDNAQVAQQKKAIDLRKKMGDEEIIAQNEIERMAREQDAAIVKRNQARALAEDAAARKDIEGRMKRAKDLRRAQVDQQIAANKAAEQLQKDAVKAETVLSRNDANAVKREDSRLNRNQKGEESQAAAALANRASEQIRAARGIYNASKMEMGRLLNEQGASISALATVMAKIPGVDPTEIVNNPAKIERARQMLSVWKEGAAGAERLDRMMTQYQKTTAKAEDGQKSLNKAIREFYTAQKFAAGADKQLTGRGAQVSAAAATVDKFGPGAVTNALGNDALVREAQALQNGSAKLSDYHKKLKETSGSSRLLTNGLNDAHSAARGLAGSLGAIWVTWGSTVPLAGMAAIGASLRATYLVGKDVEYQLKFVSLLAGNATISIQEFNSAIRGTGVAPVDAAKALRGLAQNGLSAADALRALPAILRLATAGEMELMDAALGATGVMAAFNLGIGDLGRVSDVFAFAAAKSNTSVGAMVEAMKQASTVSDQYGLTLEETAASLATLAKRNIEGSAAGTALRNMMTELAAPTDKARRAMKDLHLDLYDGTDRLKGYKQVIEELRGATIVLNEKSRITFLNELFDERGAKAANALLSDFGLLSDLFKELEKNAGGFTGILVTGLQETVQGSVKGLVSDFQQSVQQVFEESKTSVKDFIETLREAARSEDFKDFLRTTGAIVLDLTSFLVEHGKVIAITVAGWMGLRASMAIASSVGALVTSLKAAEVSLVGLRVAALGAASALTGGIALVGTLAVEYLLLRDNTSEAEKAHESFQASMRRGIQTMQDEDDRLRDLNSRLVTRNALLAQGLTVKQVEERMTGTPSTAIQEKEAALKLRQEKLDFAKREAENSRKAALVGYPKELNPFFEESRRKAVPLSEVFKQEQRDIDAQKMSLSVAKATARRLEEDQKTNRDLNEKDRYRTELANLKVERDDIMKQMKGFKVPLPDFSDTNMSADDMKRQLKDYKDAKNAALQNRMPDTTEDRARRTRQEADARSAAHAALMGEIKAVRDKEQVVKEEIRAQEQLNKAKYDPAIYGEQTVAMLAEIQAQDALNKVYEAQKRVVTELTALKAGKSNTEQQQIDNAIEEVNRQSAATQKEIDLNKQLAQIKAKNDKRKEDLSANTASAEQDADFQRIMAEIQRKSDRKTVDPVIQAQNEAMAKVAEADAQRIMAAQARLSALEAGKSAILEQRQGLRGEELKAIDQVLAKNAVDIELETRKLNIMKEQSLLNQTNAGELARSNEEYARSWQGGWDEYWKQFRDGATSNADIVKSIMGTTTDSMTQMFANFVTTGKLNFRSFASTVIAEAARVMAAKAVSSLLNFLVTTIAGSFGGASGGGTAVNGSAGTPDMSGFALTGGVWPDTPGLPTLRRFRKGGVGGGVSFGPTYTEHAEGAKPEAYVPLEDGRNIPVRVLSDGGSGAGSVQVNTYVTIDSSGKASARVETDDAMGRRLGAMVEQAVTEKMVEQMGPGGVLYNKVRN